MSVPRNRRWSNERGKGRLGCLFSILVVALAVYFGLPVGQAYFNYMSLRDEMSTQAQFAATIDDATIHRRVAQKMDQLGLPDEARANLQIRRTGRAPLQIIVSTSYEVVFQFPFYRYRHTFSPEARRPL